MAVYTLMKLHFTLISLLRHNLYEHGSSTFKCSQDSTSMYKESGSYMCDMMALDRSILLGLPSLAFNITLLWPGRCN